MFIAFLTEVEMVLILMGPPPSWKEEVLKAINEGAQIYMVAVSPTMATLNKAGRIEEVVDRMKSAGFNARIDHEESHQPHVILDFRPA